jgi:diacylglycerol kinase family enzyme
MRVIVLLNQGAGVAGKERTRETHRLVAESFNNLGIDAELRAVPGKELAAAARAAVNTPVEAIIAGGGDGTISTVAGAMLGQEKPLGILPLGTLNHFAKDLGLPLTIPEAVQVIAAGHHVRQDVAMVNEAVFINNSSLGLYPRMVLDRDAQQNQFGWGKWTAMAHAMLRVFRRFPLVEVHLQTGQDSLVRKTPLVFVGNNLYQIDLLNIGKRSCLDRGELSLYIANVQNRWGLFKLTLRAIIGRLKQSRDFESLSLQECEISSNRPLLHVSADGEVLELPPPLHYRSLPRALSVFVPKKAPS